MREQLYTGAGIYDKITCMANELEEMSLSLKEVDKALGRESTAYKLIQKQFSAKARELTNLKNQRFIKSVL